MTRVTGGRVSRASSIEMVHALYCDTLSTDDDEMDPCVVILYQQPSHRWQWACGEKNMYSTPIRVVYLLLLTPSVQSRPDLRGRGKVYMHL